MSTRACCETCLIAVAIWTALSTTLAGEVYHLDCVAGNDQSVGTAAAPWRTMAKVRETAASGDTVVLDRMDRSITATAWPTGISYRASILRHHGITWALDKDYPVGQFANHDLWVVGPITITAIDPPSLRQHGRVRNGSMLNPLPNTPQGYDSAAGGEQYNDTDNAGLGVTPAGKDLRVEPNACLLSTASYEHMTHQVILRTAAILTVLSETPPAGSFRPGYCDAAAGVRYNAKALDITKLRRLKPASRHTPIHKDHLDDPAKKSATMERWFERVWIDHTAGGSRRIHPRENMPDYGREIAKWISDAALVLNCDYTDEEKRTLLIRFVQLGLDLHSIAKHGGGWPGDGGHGSGRKLPILFAGILLHDDDMKGIGKRSGDYLYSDGHGAKADLNDARSWPKGYIPFGEDDQTFYVSSRDIQPAPYRLWALNRCKTQGSVTVSKGGKTVRGEGSDWKSGSRMRCFAVIGDGQGRLPAAHAYRIARVDGPQQITLQRPYEGESGSGKAYHIAQHLFYGHATYSKGRDNSEFVTHHLGLPEWGITHAKDRRQDDPAWDAPYRSDCTANAWCGIVLVAHIMDAKGLWNHDALFDYMDRFMTKNRDAYGVGDWRRGWSRFAEMMWDTYREQYRPIYVGIDSVHHKRIYKPSAQ